MLVRFRLGPQAICLRTRLLGSLWLGILVWAFLPLACGGTRYGDDAPKPNWSTSLHAGRDARRVDGAWRDGGGAERQATEPGLLNFIQQHPTDPKYAIMRLRLAWLRLEQNRFDEARVIVEAEAPRATGVDADWVTVIQGAILRRQGQPKRALETLLRLNGKIVDPALRDLFGEEAVQAALEASALVTASELLVGWRANGSDERQLLTQNRIESIIVRRSTDELVRMHERLSFEVTLPAAEEATRQARRWMLETVRGQLAGAVLRQKDARLARRLLTNAPTKFLRSEAGEQLRRLSELAAPPVLSLNAAVGLLLEMQDDFASRRSAEFVTGAMRALDAESSAIPIRLISREIRATSPAAIAEGLRALVSDGAGIVIAGVTPATASAALALAENEKVVVVTLSGDFEQVTPARLFVVEDAVATIERIVVGAQQGGPVRLTMQDPLCSGADTAGAFASASVEQRELLVLTDEECAKRLAVAMQSVQTPSRVWLGPEAVGAADGFREVTLVTSPALIDAEPIDAVRRWRDRFRRAPFWYEALGYDVVRLSAAALSALGVESVTGEANIERARSKIAAALPHVKLELISSQSSGFEHHRRLVPSLSPSSVASPAKGKTGP